MAFPFEQLQVYQVGLRWVEDVESIDDLIKQHLSSSFRDQLSRAALSIPLNIAEGNGRWHQAEKRQFFWIARGSVFECVPLLEVIKRKKLLSEPKIDEFRDRLDHMGRMLTSLIKSIEK